MLNRSSDYVQKLPEDNGPFGMKALLLRKTYGFTSNGNVNTEPEYELRGKFKAIEELSDIEIPKLWSLKNAFSWILRGNYKWSTYDLQLLAREEAPKEKKRKEKERLCIDQDRQEDQNNWIYC